MWKCLTIGGLTIDVFFLFNGLMGFRKDHIQIDFDERYYCHKKYKQAIHKELEKEGHEVSYKGDHKCTVDGKGGLFFRTEYKHGRCSAPWTVLKPIRK